MATSLPQYFKQRSILKCTLWQTQCCEAEAASRGAENKLPPGAGGELQIAAPASFYLPRTLRNSIKKSDGCQLQF
jgi:hypothetical protein